jgi:alpha-L-arabinofuranosidase
MRADLAQRIADLRPGFVRFPGGCAVEAGSVVFLLGCERNADAVRMVSYAPLLAQVEGRTELPGAPPPWHAMIYFDGTRLAHEFAPYSLTILRLKSR